MGIEDGFTVVDDSSDPSADTGWPSISQGHVPVGPHPFLNQEPALLAQQPVPLLPADQAITQHALINISTSLQLAYGPFTPGWAEQNSYQLDDPYQDDEPVSGLHSLKVQGCNGHTSRLISHACILCTVQGHLLASNTREIV